MSSRQSTPFDPDDDAVLTVPASLDQLRFITAFVAELAGRVGFMPDQIHRIELAVDEACSNIIIHAYRQQQNGSIVVRVRAEPGRRIVIMLIDTGTSFDPDAVPAHNPDAELEHVKIGGLGIFLMRQTMDEVQYEFGLTGTRTGEPARYNRLTLVKHL
jgi:serine/threonine-protein kinase RsbW